MYNYLHLQEKVLEEHRHNMQCEMARRRLLVRLSASHAMPSLGRHIIGLLGTRLVAIGMRLARSVGARFIAPRIQRGHDLSRLDTSGTRNSTLLRSSSWVR